mmetsp:Transcript_12274/g.16971  ORF Transcript_12274/g.16971 Transcript_12274/m.16971 type:complete len:92 (+) Transcript_12274:1245-1520(+)
MYGVAIASGERSESKKNRDLFAGREDKKACLEGIEEFEILNVLSITLIDPSDIAATGIAINGATEFATIQSQSIAFKSFDLKYVLIETLML